MTWQPKGEPGAAWLDGAPCVQARPARQAPARKPGVPVLLPCALALWAAAAAAFWLGRCADDGLLALAAGLGAAVALAAALCLLRGASPWACALLAGCAIGAALGAAGAHAMHADAQWAAAEERSYAFELLEDATLGEYGMSARARAVAEDGRSATVRVSFDACDEALCGWRFRACCQMRAPSEQSAEFYWGQGMAALAVVEHPEPVAQAGPLAWLRGLRAEAIGCMAAHGGDQAPLLQALVCGHREPIKQSGEYDRFKTAGLAHVVAVSGAHLAIVVAVLGWALRRLRAPYGLTLAALLAFTASYLVFAGIPISAVRAAIMVCLALLGRASGRRASALGALALCVIAFVACDPAASVSVSLFLSAGSTLGIVLFAPLIASWFEGAGRIGKALSEPLGLTLGSNVVTQLPAAALFSQLPLIAPVSNIVAGPLFSLGCVAGLVAAVGSCAVPAAAPVLMGAASLAAWPLSAACSALAAVPFASVAVSLPLVPMVALSAAGCLALWVAWPRLRPGALALGAGAVAAAAFVAIAVLPGLHGDAITMLDVGQGDAFLIRSGRASVLIDTGNQDSMLREALGREGVYALDAVLVTHPDDDHCASLGALSEVVSIGAVYAPADALGCPCEHCSGLRQSASAIAPSGLQGLSVGDRLTVGAFSLEVVWPRAFADEGGNADSLCVVAKLDADADGMTDWRALFCGDAEAEQLQAIVDAGVGPVDILKVGHHGSRAGLNDQVAQALSPRIALVSVGARNRYGHPAQETLDRLAAVGATTLRTDQQGSVTLQLAPGSAAIRTERG